MKNFKNLLFTLGVTFFLLTFGMKSEAEAKDPCPPGWTTLIDTVTVDGCDYEVELCVYCQFALPGKVRFNHYRNIDDCATLLNPSEIEDEIISQIVTFAYSYFDYCQFLLPPCDQKPRKKITFDIPICMKAHLYYKAPPPLNDYRYLYLPCGDDAYCSVTYSYCVDYFGVAHHTVDPGSTSHNFPYSCTKEGYEIIPLPTGSVGDESECYIIHTPCNP